MQTDFRHVLRSETRVQHDRLDHLISAIDIAELPGFRLFAQLHWQCFAVMQSRQGDPSRSRETLQAMLDGLRHDLTVINAEPGRLDAALSPRIDPLAIDYMVAGSRLGTKVLKKSWARSTDARVNAAQGYFGQEYDADLWRDTCLALSYVPVDSLRARAIVDDTRALFHLFEAAFHGLRTDEDALA